MGSCQQTPPSQFKEPWVALTGEEKLLKADQCLDESYLIPLKKKGRSALQKNLKDLPSVTPKVQPVKAKIQIGLVENPAETDSSCCSINRKPEIFDTRSNSTPHSKKDHPEWTSARTSSPRSLGTRIVPQVINAKLSAFDRTGHSKKDPTQSRSSVQVSWNAMRADK